MAYYVRTSTDPADNPSFELLDSHEFSGSLTKGEPASPEGLFTRAIQTSDHKYLPDIFTIAALWVVSEDFKRVVEALEPGVHQFFPIALQRKDGESTEKQYYLLNICQHAGGLDLERTDTYWRDAPITHKPIQIVRPGGKIVLRKAAIEGLHLWRGESPVLGFIFFSDALMDAVLEAKLPAIVGTPVEEV